MKCHQRVIQEQHRDDHPIPEDFSTASVREIPYQQAKEFILKYEWLGNMGTTVRAFGLFFGDELAAVECFGHPGSEPIKEICGKEHADKVYWLARGARTHWAHPHSSSFLVNRTCRMMGQPWKTSDGRDMPAKHVFLATADTDAGEIGTVYQASNWFYLGKASSDRMFKKPNDPPERAKSYRMLVKTKVRNRTGRVEEPATDGRRYFLVDGKQYFRGDTLPDGSTIAGSDAYPHLIKAGYGSTTKEAESIRLREVLADGYVEVKGNPKHLYCGIYAPSRLRRQLIAALKRPVLPYPKRSAEFV